MSYGRINKRLVGVEGFEPPTLLNKPDALPGYAIPRWKRGAYDTPTKLLRQDQINKNIIILIILLILLE